MYRPAFTVCLLALALVAPRVYAVWPEVGENDFRISFEGGTGTVPPTASAAAVLFHPTNQEYFVVWAAFDTDYRIVGQRLQVDGTPVGGSFLIAEGGEIIVRDVVYSPTHDHYLVIWSNPAGGGSLAGRLVSPTGSILTSTLSIAAPCSDSQGCRPKAAYSPVADEFLVVWSWDEGSSTRRVMGRRLDGETGAALFAPFPVSDGLGEEYDPAVEYHPAANEYLVVWTLVQPGDVDLVAQRLDGTAAGQVGANDFVISSGPGVNFGAFRPDIAYNSLDQEYLVVWQGRSDGAGPLADDEMEVFGQRLSASGSEVGANDFRLTDVGGLGSVEYFPGSPRVDFIPSAGLFLVVWGANENVGGLFLHEEEIFGQLLDRDGNEVGPNDVRLSDAGGTGTARYIATSPRVASSDASEEFLVIWSADDNLPGMAEDEFEVYGQRIDTELTIYLDGFESGNVSAWSSSVP